MANDLIATSLLTDAEIRPKKTARQLDPPCLSVSVRISANFKTGMKPFALVHSRMHANNCLRMVTDSIARISLPASLQGTRSVEICTTHYPPYDRRKPAKLDFGVPTANATPDQITEAP